MRASPSLVVHIKCSRPYRMAEEGRAYTLTSIAITKPTSAIPCRARQQTPSTGQLTLSGRP